MTDTKTNKLEEEAAK